MTRKWRTAAAADPEQCGTGWNWLAGTVARGYFDPVAGEATENTAFFWNRAMTLFFLGMGG